MKPEKGGIMRPRFRSLMRAPYRLLPLLLILLAPSSAFPNEDRQDVPASDPGPAGETLEGTRGYVGAFGGYSTAGAEGLEDGFLVGGNAAFFLLEHVGIEAGVHRRSTDLASTPSNALSGGSLDSTIVTAGVVFRFPVSARVVPYVAGGVAYFSNSFEIDASLSGRLAALNFQATEEVDSALGFNVGGGAYVVLARRFQVFGEARYLNALSDTRAELRDTISGTTAEVGGNQGLNSLEIRAGVHFVFSRR
ncbi:MAG TPA: outer membrane beta-barrel protein [Vicinamibacteria bacterium]|nr:outer membrane beta-barrel protein [Vicinamibacteria bacterium]